MFVAVCGAVLWLGGCGEEGAWGLGSGVGEEKTGAPVKVTVDGGKAILDNGIIAATIDTANARVVSLKYCGKEMMGVVYFSMAGGTSYENPNHCAYSVTKQTPEMVDISCKRIFLPGKDKHAWDIDVHYVLHRGKSGLYSYATLEHQASYPNARMGEWRTVYKIPSGLFERIYVDDVRQWEMPSAADFKLAEQTSIPEATLLTTGPRAGKYDCKYEYAAEYRTVGVYGHASNVNNLGAWIVPGVCDWLNDGPMKADLAPAAGIIHLHLNGNHFGGSNFTIRQGETWKKIYGPWLIYFNNKKGAEACWADAKRQAAEENAAWPYAWLDNELYQAKERTVVKGKFIAKDPLKPDLSTDGAWVGLALPEKEAGPWQSQGKSYQYWAKAGKLGSFSIKGVRPGTYTLYAFTKGAVGEFSKEDVTVKAGTPLDLGNITWNVTHPGKTIAWEIGVPDRLPAEFRHGSTDYWEPFLYEKFSSEFANPLEYNVAEKNWGTALNYVQSTYDGWPWKWRLNFELAQAPSGDAMLTLAFAGSDRMRVRVSVNNEPNEVAIVTPPNAGGNGLVREAQHMNYGLSYVKIPAGMLKAGQNVITLEGVSSSARSCYVSYDYINLELP
jgi:rhamnogalacturonan endolyase